MKCPNCVCGIIVGKGEKCSTCFGSGEILDEYAELKDLLTSTRQLISWFGGERGSIDQSLADARQLRTRALKLIEIIEATELERLKAMQVQLALDKILSHRSA